MALAELLQQWKLLRLLNTRGAWRWWLLQVLKVLKLLWLHAALVLPAHQEPKRCALALKLLRLLLLILLAP